MSSTLTDGKRPVSSTESARAATGSANTYREPLVLLSGQHLASYQESWNLAASVAGDHPPGLVSNAQGSIFSTLLIERTFGETRRRVKVIGRLPGERSCLGFVWAVLDRASRGWRGVTMTPATVRQLQDLRRQLLDPPTAGDPRGQLDETVTAAAWHHYQEPASLADFPPELERHLRGATLCLTRALREHTIPKGGLDS